ncbi:MAG TPA: PAS domain-containing protein [Polyangiaceae bacterium]|jgi:PAS domain S-box-containing protein|nr:PAS domain-containing protein [Polyangiaceae bacterium]
MREPDSPAAQEVSTFLREARRLARQNSEHLETLASQRAAAAKRLASFANAPSEQLNLIEELTVRDEELRAVTDELREQVEAMKRAAALLERERSKYIQLFAHAPDAYIVTNLAGVIDEANIAAAGLFRTEPSLLANRGLITFVARQDTRTFRSFLQRLQTADPARAEGPHRAVLRMRPRGQAVFVVSLRVSVVSSDNGRPLALRWVLRDVDPDETEAGRGAGIAALAETLADDLRGPLGPIAAWVQSLRDWGDLDEEARAFALRSIEKSASLQQSKLDHLAELAQAHAAPPAPDDESESSDVVEDARRAIAKLTAGDASGDPPRIALRCKVATGEARVPGPNAFRSIELFLQRAIEGTPRMEPIEVTVAQEGRDVVLDVHAPEGARVPDNWEVRTATATRNVERGGGRVVLHVASPTARLRWRARGG